MHPLQFLGFGAVRLPLAQIAPDAALIVFYVCNAQEYVFRGIQKGEWLNLFNFIRQKRLRIENLREAEAGPQGPGLAVDLGADIDTGDAC